MKNARRAFDEREKLCYNKDMEKRILALDIGDKRIGVAVSDPFNEYAMPCETYARKGRFFEDVDAVAKIAYEKGVGEIVCGLPVNADGTDSVQTEKTRSFVETLKEKTTLPVVFEDERYTTAMARNDQIAGGIGLKDRKKSIDSIAAAYILESYLSKRKEKKTMTEQFDEEYEENLIELEDEEGNVESFIHVGTIEYKGGWYCFFQKAEPESEEEEDEVVIYQLVGEEGDQQLVPIEDDQLMDEVFAEFCKEYEAYENSEDAKKLDGAE